MRSFRTLNVWHKAHTLTLDVYRQTAGFPRDEIYGLTSQLRRASASIAANIAEGCGRSSQADFARFLSIALGSASETEYHLLLAHDLGFLSDEQYPQLNAMVIDVKRMLSTLITRLQSLNTDS